MRATALCCGSSMRAYALLERLRGVLLLWEKEELRRKGKSAAERIRRGGAEDITYPLVSFSSISSDIPLSRRKPPGLWMGMKIITPAGQAHSPPAIIYRHPLDKVLAFGVQWKFESFRWKCGRRNNVCVLGANVSESMSSLGKAGYRRFYLLRKSAFLYKF